MRHHHRLQAGQPLLALLLGDQPLLAVARFPRLAASRVQTVTLDAPAVVSSLGSLTVRLLGQGVAAGTSAAMALGQLNDRTKEAASVRAYDDCFLMYAIIALLTLVPVLMVPRRHHQH